jgi:hypothetical protein
MTAPSDGMPLPDHAKNGRFLRRFEIHLIAPGCYTAVKTEKYQHAGDGAEGLATRSRNACSFEH